MENLEIKFENVDSFQGQQADIAIFSVTRSNDNSKIGFLSSAERLNVALSRAQDALVIVGDDEFVSQMQDSRSDLPRVLRHILEDSECKLEVFE